MGEATSRAASDGWRRGQRERLIGVLLLACLGAACGHRGTSEGQRRPSAPGEVWLTDAEVRTMHLRIEPAAIQAIDDTITVNGRVTFGDTQVFHAYSPVAGRVKSILVALGQEVHPGDALAVIEAPDIGMASSDLGKAEADAIAAAHERQRALQMMSEGAGSQRELERAEDEDRRAQAELARARERLALFRSGTVDRVTQTFTLRSMIEGEVVARNAAPGVEVQGQYAGGVPFELLTIGNLDRVWVLGEVYEVDFERVHVGASATVHVVSYPDRVFEGRIDWIAGALDPVTHVARVRVELDNPQHVLRPEMLARIDIATESARALAIPTTARLRLGDGTVVFVERGRSRDGRRRFVSVPVVVDETASDRWLPVLHGLSAGERVVVDNGIELAGLL